MNARMNDRIMVLGSKTCKNVVLNYLGNFKLVW